MGERAGLMAAERGATVGYDALYRDFDAPLMQTVRREAYGEDIGQHSWVTADDLRRDIAWLELAPSSVVLDLGCGPCGPLTFMLSSAGCRGTGVDASVAALRAGEARARSLGVSDRLELHLATLDEALPFADRSFDAVTALDVVLHVRDRAALFVEVARVLRPGGRFLFTDAGVLTGAIGNDELQWRSANGYVQVVAVGCNERWVEGAGLRVESVEDRTASMLANARGRRAAMRRHEGGLRAQMGDAAYDGQLRYLDVVERLAMRGALSRMAYRARA